MNIHQKPNLYALLKKYEGEITTIVTNRCEKYPQEQQKLIARKWIAHEYDITAQREYSKARKAFACKLGFSFAAGMLCIYMGVELMPTIGAVTSKAIGVFASMAINTLVIPVAMFHAADKICEQYEIRAKIIKLAREECKLPYNTARGDKAIFSGASARLERAIKVQNQYKDGRVPDMRLAA